MGGGYTLTLAKDLDKESSSRNGDNSAQYLTGLQKEGSRKALHFVRSVVTNSSLISGVGTEVTISLPLDATHLFAELLKKIDHELPTVGIHLVRDHVHDVGGGVFESCLERETFVN